MIVTNVGELNKSISQFNLTNLDTYVIFRVEYIPSEQHSSPGLTYAKITKKDTREKPSALNKHDTETNTKSCKMSLRAVLWACFHLEISD